MPKPRPEATSGDTPAGPSGDVESLDARQQRAAWLVALDEMDLNDVACEMGIDRRTLWKWRQTPDFQAALATARREIADGLKHDALSRLRRIIRRDPTPTAFPAIELVLKAAGYIASPKGGDSGAPHPSPDASPDARPLADLDSGELDGRIEAALRDSRGGEP